MRRSTTDLVWYFAYGSNMQPDTFRGRRGIVAREAVPARLVGWRLVLDKPPIVPVGGAMANVVEEPAGHVLGVAYAVTPDDLAHIDLTEGVLIGNYRRVAVRLTALDGGRELDAFTLTSERRDQTLCPSRRYMALLIEGALTHGLPDDYVEWLRCCPAEEETPEAVAARRFIDEGLRRRLGKKEPR
jgi:cation transport regulator ChaC